MDTKLTPEMDRWFNDQLRRADLANDVATKVDSDGKYIRTPTALCFEILNEVKKAAGDLSGKKALVVDTVEFLPVLLTFGFQKCNITFVAPYEYKGKIAKALGVNVVQDSLLTWKTNMKFDVVVGNPPYQLENEKTRQREFYQQFIYKSISLAPVTGFVIPSRWTSLNNATYKKFSNNILDAGLKEFKWLPANAFPGVQMETCYFVTDNKSTITNVSDRNGNTGAVDIKSVGYYPTDVTKISLLQKITAKSYGASLAPLSASGSLYENALQPGPTKIVFRAGRTGEPIPYYFGNAESVVATELVGSHKVVLSRNGAVFKLGPVKPCDPDAGIGFACFGIKTNSYTESENLCVYLCSKVIKFLVSEYKTGTKGNSKELFSKIGTVDLTRKWEDADLYSHFGLTQEEINYIEATIK